MVSAIVISAAGRSHTIPPPLGNGGVRARTIPDADHKGLTIPSDHFLLSKMVGGTTLTSPTIFEMSFRLP